ncbi:metallophosphoesterase family protein [Planctomicrobium sp. SH668]|uniref:metallophosphoesterase family protein n=1 Tax=Planctomicrobium sp. SH668 TaxID=3448126 RepID=UPI003F5C366B
MPIHFQPMSRRSFLASTAAALASLTVLRVAPAAVKNESITFALLSDTHVPSNPTITGRNVNMTDNIKSVVSQILQMKEKPAGVLINGDCAYLQGLDDDYKNLASCVQPLLDAELPLHLLMGNHDNRERLYTHLAHQKPEHPPVDSRHISVLETPFANLFLLDTLTQTNVVTGQIGSEQMEWLAKALDERSDRPAIVFAHHTPQFQAPEAGKPWGGIEDTEAFINLLESKKNVKAFVFGHSHVWSHTSKGDLQLINLPAVAYTFSDEVPNGWTIGNITSKGMTFQLVAHSTEHPKQGETFKVSFE